MNKGERSLVKTFDGFYLPLMRKGEELLLKKEEKKSYIARFGDEVILFRTKYFWRKEIVLTFQTWVQK